MKKDIISIRVNHHPRILKTAPRRRGLLATMRCLRRCGGDASAALIHLVSFAWPGTSTTFQGLFLNICYYFGPQNPSLIVLYGLKIMLTAKDQPLAANNELTFDKLKKAKAF